MRVRRRKGKGREWLRVRGFGRWAGSLRGCTRKRYLFEPDSDRSEPELLDTPQADRKRDPPFLLSTPTRRRELCGSQAAFVGVTSQVTDLIDQINATLQSYIMHAGRGGVIYREYTEC